MASLLQRVQHISWMRVVSKRQAALFPASAISSPRRLFGTNIKVILKDDVPGTGYRGEYVEVKAGFMRNYLFPKKRAMYATEENKFLYESVDRTGEKERAVALKAMKRGRKEMAGVTMIMKRYLPTGETRLDHAVTAKYVYSYLRKKWQFKGTEKDIRMPNGNPIESLGKHVVMVRIALPEAAVPILQEELGVKEFEKQAWVEMTMNIERTTTKVKEQLEDAEEIVEEGEAGEEGPEEARGNEQEKDDGVSSSNKS